MPLLHTLYKIPPLLGIIWANHVAYTSPTPVVTKKAAVISPSTGYVTRNIRPPWVRLVSKVCYYTMQLRSSFLDPRSTDRYASRRTLRNIRYRQLVLAYSPGRGETGNMRPYPIRAHFCYWVDVVDGGRSDQEGVLPRDGEALHFRDHYPRGSSSGDERALLLRPPPKLLCDVLGRHRFGALSPRRRIVARRVRHP